MLDRRLKAAADYVRENSPAVDVGTDHASLAVYLYEKGITSQVTACDINEKPLEAARKTIMEHELTGKINVVRSDGLDQIPPEQAQDIVICGMGGELILRILLASTYTRQGDRRFILQPMTNVPFLRKGLYQNGFAILSETPVLDANHAYTVMLVHFTGECEQVTPLFALVGKMPACNSPDCAGYLKSAAKRQQKIAAGLRKSSEKSAEAASYEALAAEILCLGKR